MYIKKTLFAGLCCAFLVSAPVICSEIATENCQADNTLRECDESLVVAINNCDGDGIKAALACGAQVNLDLEDGCTPLCVAVMQTTVGKDPREIIRVLLDAGASRNVTVVIQEQKATIQQLAQMCVEGWNYEVQEYSARVAESVNQDVPENERALLNEYREACVMMAEIAQDVCSMIS